LASCTHSISGFLCSAFFVTCGVWTHPRTHFSRCWCALHAIHSS
jgi:hypothetical protein